MLRDIGSRPQAAPRQKVVGFPIGYVIENEPAAKSEPVPYLGGDPNYGTWRGLKVEDFKVSLTVLPGRTMEDTVFCVTYVGPPGYQQTSTTIEITFDGDEEHPYSFESGTMVKGWAVFKGSDLWRDTFLGTGRSSGIRGLIQRSEGGVEARAEELGLPIAISCQAEIGVRDPRPASAASRGATYLYIQSPPAKLR